MRILAAKVSLTLYRIKFLFNYPKLSLLHLISRNPDFSKITIDELKKYLINPRVIVEAGAADGVETLMFANNFSNCTIFAIEPIKMQFDFLQNKFTNTKNVQIYHFALSDRNELTSIFVGSANKGLDGMGSSSLFKPDLHKKYFPNIVFDNIQEIKGITLENFILNNKIDFIDLLWLDIQGAELKVMQASEAIMRDKVKSLHIEISRVKFYEGTPSEKDIRTFLVGIGFKCAIDRVGAISGNALYVNEKFTKLREDFA